MGKVVRFPTWAGKRPWASTSATVADITTGLAKIVAELAEQSQLRANGKSGFLEGQRIHKSIRGDMVRSKSELAIADLLFSFERQGRLTYFVEPQLPFASAPERWADFMVRFHGENWYWEHCPPSVALRATPPPRAGEESLRSLYRRRFEAKKALYEKNGYSVYSRDNPNGRLIVTYDGRDRSLDTQALYRLARELFVRPSR